MSYMQLPCTRLAILLLQLGALCCECRTAEHFLGQWVFGPGGSLFGKTGSLGHKSDFIWSASQLTAGVADQ